jgi:hypothetical protein
MGLFRKRLSEEKGQSQEAQKGERKDFGVDGEICQRRKKKSKPERETLFPIGEKKKEVAPESTR